jgi:glucose-6-phosphate-specific signal transduction histidine kinase
MMPDNEQYEKLLYQYEVLLARLTIREHYLKTVVKEIYENIGQVLSLIRVQLSLLQSDLAAGSKEKADTSGELVGQTIRELRTMCQLFYPEEEIISSSGFCKAIIREIKIQYPGAECHVQEESIKYLKLDSQKGLLLFGILLELFSLISGKQTGRLTSATIEYAGDKININIDYCGEIIRRNKATRITNYLNLSVFDRTRLLGGDMQIKNAGYGNRRIKLVAPIN